MKSGAREEEEKELLRGRGRREVESKRPIILRKGPKYFTLLHYQC